MSFTHIRPLLFFLCPVLLFCFSCNNGRDTKENRTNGGKKIVSYIRTWPLGSTVEDMKKGVHWRGDDINGDKITTLNIAFGLIKDGTGIYIKDMYDSPDGMPGFKDLYEQIRKVKKNNPGLRINLSIGGWGADGFSDMAFTAETRAVFVANALAFVKEHDLDGVDIDWEYPVNGGWGTIKARPEDRENFTHLMVLLKEELNKLGKKTGKKYEISFAAGASPDYLTWIEPKKVAAAVDYIKLMCYDFYGAWSQTTGHLGNLYSNPEKPEDLYVAQVVDNFINAGFPPEKILLGVPFYGRGWEGVKSDKSGLYQEHTGAVYPDGITYPDILKLMKEDKSFKRYWDDQAKCPYIYNGDVWITYEDPQSLEEKIQYIQKKGLRGIMFWEYAHDMDNDLLDVINRGFEKR